MIQSQLYCSMLKNNRYECSKIGSFFMINLCLVVIATQFSETKKREMERMRQERARFHSTSTLASSTNTSEPTTCYAEIIKWELQFLTINFCYVLYVWILFQIYCSYSEKREEKAGQEVSAIPMQETTKAWAEFIEGSKGQNQCYYSSQSCLWR